MRKTWQVYQMCRQRTGYKCIANIMILKQVKLLAVYTNEGRNSSKRWVRSMRTDKQ